jgi:cytidylate kinase
MAELEARGARAHYDDVLIDIKARDERDMGRATAPLLRAKDAELLDTSDMDVAAAIARAIALVEARLD